jgi:hypothetical protein
MRLSSGMDGFYRFMLAWSVILYISAIGMVESKRTPPANTMTCDNGRRRIPTAWINDGYCDCPIEGSDEPLTGACGGAINFQCRNAGFLPALIPYVRFFLSRNVENAQNQISRMLLNNNFFIRRGLGLDFLCAGLVCCRSSLVNDGYCGMHRCFFCSLRMPR